jgi:hypothetical protein
LLSARDPGRPAVKKPEEVVEILEAYDLTGSLRRAAVLAGCDHKTVARLVAAREAAGGGLPERERRRPLVDPFAAKVEELVDRSRGRIGADQAHSKLVAMGYQGSEAHDPAGGGGGEASLAAEAWAAHAAVDPGAGAVAAVGLWGWAGRDGRKDGVVLRVACVVALSGRGAIAGQDAAVRGDWAGPDVAAV